MKGKTVLVTGATNGIGKAIAQGIAEKGAEIIIISRNEAKCKSVAELIQAQTNHSNIRYYAADLSSQAEIRTLSATLRQDLSRLDVLVNNAGAWFTDRKLSVDGIEMTWSLNHLGYFLLTNELLDLLKDTARKHGEARVINQSSYAHHEGTMHWNNIELEGTWKIDGRGRNGPGWGAYSQSKLANVLHAFALARKLQGTGVVANAVHPGSVVTGISQNNGLVYQVAAPIRRLFNRRTPQQGAEPAIYLASDPEAGRVSGAYYGPPRKREAVNKIAESVNAQDRLWQMSTEQVERNQLPNVVGDHT